MSSEKRAAQGVVPLQDPFEVIVDTPDEKPKTLQESQPGEIDVELILAKKVVRTLIGNGETGPIVETKVVLTRPKWRYESRVLLEDVEISGWPTRVEDRTADIIELEITEELKHDFAKLAVAAHQLLCAEVRADLESMGVVGAGQGSLARSRLGKGLGTLAAICFGSMVGYMAAGSSAKTANSEYAPPAREAAAINCAAVLEYPEEVQECSWDADLELRLANEAFKAGDNSQAVHHFDRAAQCGEEYSALAARLFDPSVYWFDRAGLPQPSLALRYYKYAIRRGTNGEYEGQLASLAEWIRGKCPASEELLRDAKETSELARRK